MSTIKVVTPEDVLDHLGIDYADDMINRKIERLINTADAYLKGAIGEDYPVEDSRAKELALLVISDLYENRGLTSTVSANTRSLVNDLSLQLKLELSRRDSNG